MSYGKQFNTLLNHLSEGVIIVSEDFDILFANEIAIKYFGNKIIDIPIYNVIRNSELIDAINENQSIDTMFSYNSSIGKHTLELSYHHKKNTLGIMIIRDKTIEEKFQSVRKDLIANVSHELRSPLTSISGFIETLQNEEIDQNQRAKFLGIMKEESNRMDRIISDLLSLSKIEINMYAELDEKIDQIKTAKDALDLRADELGKSINIRYPDYDTPNISADSDQIIEVFHNLIDNAIKYSHENSAIDILVELIERQDRSYLKSSVINVGTPISEEHLPRLTERFYRVDKARSRNVGGTGLGLAIVKHILLRHNAELEITSDIDGKTTFSIFFPVDNN
ncbi:MAG: ATP-binding protein [Hyphomicrobiales bacterium]